MKKWPNFFIVGAPKAGTTSLYEYLKQIPGVYMSPEKEPRYFSPNYQYRRIGNQEKYLQLFSASKDEKIIGEASPSYLRDPDAARLIHETIPDAKIVILLRDPVERAFSHYLMYLQRYTIKSSFSETIRIDLKILRKDKQIEGILEAGFYYEQIKRYIEKFGKNQVKILVFEEFIKEPKKTVEDVLRFCGIEYAIPNFKAEKHNKFLMPRHKIIRTVLNDHKLGNIIYSFTSTSTRLYLGKKFFTKKVSKPTMSEEDKIYLQKMYRQDVKNTCYLLNRTLPWGNFI
jgi:hypothetical protein